MLSFCRRQLLLLAWILVARASMTTAAVFATEELCTTNITVQYQDVGGEPMLGPIVLGRGQNGATISLHPGTFIATAEVHICNAEGETEDAVAYRGVTRLIDWRSSSDDGTSIVIYAIDIRAHTADEAVDYDVPPVIMSIEISPRTIEVDGSAAQIVATARDFNYESLDAYAAGYRSIRDVNMRVFDVETGSELAGNSTVTINVGVDPNKGPIKTATFEWQALEAMFNSSKPVHRLRAEITVTDNGGLSDFGVVAFTANRYQHHEIGAHTFRAPRINEVDIANQTYRTVHEGAGSSPAEIRLSVYDSDSETEANYTEDIFVSIEGLEPSAMGAGNQSHTIPSASCIHTHGLASCEYIECECDSIFIPGVGTTCAGLTVTKPDGDGIDGTWSFQWNPWQNITAAAGMYGTTYCQLRLYFYDNTASLNSSMQSVPEGLRTRTATFLLVASPGTPAVTEVNHPPSVTSLWVAHTEVTLGEVSGGAVVLPHTTITVRYEDTDGVSAPTAVLGLGDGISAAFVPFVASDLVGAAELVCEASACTGRWTVNASQLSTGAPVHIYLQLTDSVTGSVGLHRVATVTVTAARRLRRALLARQRTARSVPAVRATTVITIQIANGTLSASTDGQVRNGPGGGSTTSPQLFVAPDGEAEPPGKSTHTVIIASMAGVVLLLIGIIAGLHCRRQNQPKAPQIPVPIPMPMPVPMPMSHLLAAESAHLWPAETGRMWPQGSWPSQTSRTVANGSVVNGYREPGI